MDSTSPELGILDCEKEKLLCASWFVSCPSLAYYQIPPAQIGEERPPITVALRALNTTSVTGEGIYKFHSEKQYVRARYEGILHPTDGFLAKYKLNLVVGSVIYGLSAIPSWLFMVGISLISRTIT